MDGDEAGAGGVPGPRRRKKRRQRRRRKKRKKKKKKKQEEEGAAAKGGQGEKIRVSLVMQQKSAAGSREWITNLKIPAQMLASDFRIGVLEVLRDRGDIPACVKIRTEGECGWGGGLTHVLGFLSNDASLDP